MTEMTPVLAPLPPHPRDNEMWGSLDGDALDVLLAQRGLTIRDKREASRCTKCGFEQYDPDTDTYAERTQDCPHGCCVVFACPNCGDYSSGMGAAGCPCDDGI